MSLPIPLILVFFQLRNDGYTPRPKRSTLGGLYFAEISRILENSKESGIFFVNLQPISCRHMYMSQPHMHPCIYGPIILCIIPRYLVAYLIIPNRIIPGQKKTLYEITTIKKGCVVNNLDFGFIFKR